MNVKNPVRTGALASAVLLLSGCVGPGTEMTVLPTRIDYQCAQNKLLQVQRAPDARNAAVLIDGKPVILQRADSAAQEKYSNGNLTLYLEGERAVLEENSRVLFGPCAAGPLPKAERYR